ncbi:MAG: glycosyltransferase, partial [Methylococcaceae bacterium]
LSPGNNVRQSDSTLVGRVVSRGVTRVRYPINIFCMTGFDTVRAYLEYGDSLFKDKYNIGWWPWELSVWPGLLHSAFERVNEIWAATQFTRVMYETSTHIPVHLMPLPVSVARVEFCSRATLGIPDSKFLFLYVFDFNSYLERKNPAAVISAFRLAFPDQDESVGLVLKTMNTDSDNPLWQQFRLSCLQDKRITLLDQTMTRSQVLGLIESCDVYVSLHRSEGFGRTLAESMLFGKPVVATDYSGTCDFLTPDTGFPVQWTEQSVRQNDYPFVMEGEAVWANPDINHAARQMVQARKESANPAFINRVRSYSVQQFSAKRIGLLMRDRLLNCFQSL